MEKSKTSVSEFDDDYDGIPAYEQIYAPQGLYKHTDSTAIQKFLKTLRKPLTYSMSASKTSTEVDIIHIHAVTLSAHEEGLGRNKAKKNWNSQIMLRLLDQSIFGTGEESTRHFQDTFDTITDHFPDYEESPFVQENSLMIGAKTKHGIQQNRAVVGHNLKIAWNLMRFYAEMPKEKYLQIAENCNSDARKGYDSQRFGWYDVVERVLGKMKVSSLCLAR